MHDQPAGRGRGQPEPGHRQGHPDQFLHQDQVDGPLRIGSRVVIGSSVAIASGRAGIEIGDDCFLSPNVVLTPGTHRYARLDAPIITQGMASKGIRIGSDVWIGANCTVLDGSEIGSGSIVGANSVVNGKISPLSIAQGNPAKVIFTRR
jgi:acetyltransferase-like isoleucine patch superfamily enzyme